MEKLIITAAVVGAETMRADNPNLPLTPEELAQATYDCWRAGASVVHLHVRDADGQPTQNPKIFAQTMQLIQERCDIIIQVSTGGAIGMSVEERVQPLQLHPEMASLTTGTVNFGNDVFYNSWPYITHIAKAIKENGVKPELGIFEPSMIETARQLVKQGLLSPPLHCTFALGGNLATARYLAHLVDSLPAGSHWGVAGLGRAELQLAALAIVMGGHVRVGFEDNVYYSRGVLAESNAQLVERVARLAQELQREVATPAEARQILGIPAR